MNRFGLSASVSDAATLKAAVKHLRDRSIILPTFAELENPERIPAEHALDITRADPDAADWRNLFRIHWHNSADRRQYVPVPAHLVLPRSLTGVDAPIAVVLGDRFPMISAHKVLAAYGCLVPRLVTGRFDPTWQRAVWPSTGNYCRGGVAVSRIMGCRGVAVLPAKMSQERFSWLRDWVGSPEDIIRTPGSESNVKEIYDECASLQMRPENVILNQFCEFGNTLAHYRVTGRALSRLVEYLTESHQQLRAFAFISATGSAGTIAAGDRLKESFGSRVVAVEAIECPTLLRNGYGEHHIQGIGDKHIPYIHNVYNTDDIVGISDAATDALYYLANSSVGQTLLSARGVPDGLTRLLGNLGFSAWANILAAIAIARSYRLGPDDLLLTVATDSGALYRSEQERILRDRFRGSFDVARAAEAFGQYVLGGAAQHLQLGNEHRDRIFNLGYFTWVEQQGVLLEEFAARRSQSFWVGMRALTDQWDERIRAFNARAAGD